MRILLPLSIWISVKPACTTTLISFCISVAFAIKTDGVPKLNAWINFPTQVRMIKYPIVPCDDLDLSNFILINPSLSFIQVTQWVFLRLKVEDLGLVDELFM